MWEPFIPAVTFECLSYECLDHGQLWDFVSSEAIATFNKSEDGGEKVTSRRNLQIKISVSSVESTVSSSQKCSCTLVW